MSMYCNQCEETAKHTACTIKGVCGKEPDVANLQDLALYVVKGLAFWATQARSVNIYRPEISHYIAETLFSTITNANFDTDWFVEQIKTGIKLRNGIKRDFLTTYQAEYGEKYSQTVPAAANWQMEKESITYLVTAGKKHNTEIIAEEEDVRSLIQLITYGLKGMAAYADHALRLGYEEKEIWTFMEKTLCELLMDNEASSLLETVLETGEYGIKTMALLDKANTSAYGHPEPTKVNISVGDKPGILVSGHDLRDLKELLEQSEGTGIDIYTHGEMLPGNAYPELKKYKHLKGNYGGSWWHQKKEFNAFNGPVLLTTNCLVPPKEEYFDKLYVTGTVGYPNAKRIEKREDDEPKDFSAIIDQAKECKPPKPLETGNIDIGFAHHTVLSMADKVVTTIKEGKIRRFIVMGGCDGRKRSREYFTEVAKQLPEDTIILTAGCAKYRYNKLDLGTIEGIPRILDAGQCNDSYSLVLIAQKLAEAFDLDSINELPLSFDLGWYEQKAVLVLLALLHLKVKNIRIGPTLPAFLSENVVNIIVDKFNLQLIDEPAADIQAMLQS